MCFYYSCYMSYLPMYNISFNSFLCYSNFLNTNPTLLHQAEHNNFKPHSTPDWHIFHFNPTYYDGVLELHQRHLLNILKLLKFYGIRHKLGIAWTRLILIWNGNKNFLAFGQYRMLKRIKKIKSMFSLQRQYYFGIFSFGPRLFDMIIHIDNFICFFHQCYLFGVFFFFVRCICAKF